MASRNLDVKEILQQLERLPQAARYAVYGGIFVLVIALYWMTMYGGEQKTLNTKRAQLTKLESEIAEVHAIASNLSKFREQRELLQNAWLSVGSPSWPMSCHARNIAAMRTARSLC